MLDTSESGPGPLTVVGRPRRARMRFSDSKSRHWHGLWAAVLASLLLLGFAAQEADGQSAGGTKPLYLYDLDTADPNGFNAGPAPYLSRTPPVGTQDPINVDKGAPPLTWSLTPALQAPLTIDAGTIPISLFLGKSGGSANPQLRTVTVSLGTSGAISGPLGTPVTQTFFAPARDEPIEVVFDIPLAAVTILPTGTQISLSLVNETQGGGVRRLRVFPVVGGSFSRAELPALTVISIDGAATFDTPFPAGIATSVFAPGNDVTIRADVSDPFGSFDISEVVIDIFDDTGAAVVTGQAMGFVQSLTGATDQFEFTFTLPFTATGTWTYTITAIEGTERLITDVHTGTFLTSGPLLTLSKSVSVLSDPVNGGTNPKAIPGAVMLYTITVSNSGAGEPDSGTLVVGDVLPTATALYVGTSGGAPITFIDGTPSSGLGFNYPTAVSFSSQPDGGPPYDYLPTPDAAGFDPLITGMRVNPAGALAGNSGSGTPSFQLRYLMRVE